MRSAHLLDVSTVTDDSAIDAGRYCREIEAYLCRKNGGHLVRVVGPAFSLVAGWAQQGVPLKVVLKGIDRRLDRQAAGGSRRRPIRIEFCEADVLGAFDEWRRAVGVRWREQVDNGAGHAGAADAVTGATDAAADPGEVGDVATPPELRRGPSLPRHLRRVIDRLSALPWEGARPRPLEAWVASAVTELGQLERQAATLRGAERARAVERLRELDGELLDCARAHASDDVIERARGLANDELRPFAARMSADALREASERASARHLREALRLPVIELE